MYLIPYVFYYDKHNKHIKYIFYKENNFQKTSKQCYPCFLKTILREFFKKKNHRILELLEIIKLYYFGHEKLSNVFCFTFILLILFFIYQKFKGKCVVIFPTLKCTRCGTSNNSESQVFNHKDYAY